MMDFLRDLRLGFRLLLRAPGFAVTAILTLALGIGATTALFTVVNAVLLDPLPFPGRRARFARRAGHGAQKRMTKNEERRTNVYFVIRSLFFVICDETLQGAIPSLADGGSRHVSSNNRHDHPEH